MTKVIIKSEDNKKEIVIFIFLSPEEIKKTIEEAEKEELAREELDKLLEILKEGKSLNEIKREIKHLNKVIKCKNTKDISVLIEVLSELFKIKGIENIEFINIPDNVEADIGVKIKLKKGYGWLDINNQISDLLWKVFEEKGDYPVIYREFEET